MAKIELQVSDQRREDMLVGALEGGSNYWYLLGLEADQIIRAHMEMDDAMSIGMWRAIRAGKTIPIHDVENPEEKLGEINLASIDKGEQLMAKDYLRHFTDILNDEDDANTADIWFQLAVLGDVVYG